MSQEQLLSGLKKDVRSLLLSAKNGLSPEQLKKDYFTMLGHPLPLRTHGFRTVMDMVKDMPDVVAVDYLADGTMVLKVIGDSSTKGIEELVAKQRNPKPKLAVRKAGVGSCFPHHPQHTPLLPRRGHAPPALPVQLRSQLRQLLAQGPVTLSELEPSFARRFGRPLQVTHYGFYSIAEMLSAAADIVAVKQSRTGSLLTLKRTIKPLTQALSSALSPQQSTRNAAKPPPNTGENVLLSSNHRNTPELPQEVSPSSKLEEGNQWLLSLSVIQLEKELRNGILESGAAGTVSLELKERLRQVIAQNHEGLSIHNLPEEFKRVFAEDLPVAQCGFLSVTEMVSALSDSLYLQPGPEEDANSWIVKDNQYRNTKQGREEGNALCATESMNPSKGSFYLNSEESRWEKMGERDEPSQILRDDTDTRVTTKTFSQLADMFPAVAVQVRGALVPPDAIRGERLRPPTRRRERELVPVLVERVESPSHFYVRFHETREARKLETMMIEMRSCYSSPEVAERYRLPAAYVRPGQVCCLAPHGLWLYRVLIHRVLSESQVEVYYVDFGDLSTADRSSLKFLKSCYSELPAQAVPSSLTGVRPTSGSWSTSAVSYFRKLCCERALVAAVHSYHEDVLHLFLCDTHTEEDVYVHTALQTKGHAFSCTSSFSRVMSGPFNPVTMYMGTGMLEELTVPDSATECSSVSSNGHSPDHSNWSESRNKLVSTRMVPSLTGRRMIMYCTSKFRNTVVCVSSMCTCWQGASLDSRTKVTEDDEDLPDLPELEFIDIPEVSSPAQQRERNNLFGALVCKDYSDWDKGWTPDTTAEDANPKPESHTAPPCPAPKDSAEEGPLQEGCVMETPPAAPTQPALPPAQQPPATKALSPLVPGRARTQSCSGGVSGVALQQQTSSFVFPWLRYTSPTVLGPSARLAAGAHHLNWSPYKIA
ncbi:tudor domain-containing protein 5 [Megalops cyprinoides]|uniref:tudor domain-containing protein 5 n=1 Tax=Megalops cyprinoides TaxID=118141 RepID=UPI001863B299|nr:tudor domain-containing protein 5 [Megalops cyprinoides]